MEDGTQARSTMLECQMKKLLLLAALAIVGVPGHAHAWSCYVKEGSACRSSALGNMDSTCTYPCSVARTVSGHYGISRDQARRLIKRFGHDSKKIDVAAKKMKAQQ